MLADQVYDELIVAMVDGDYEPGDGLNIDALARELEVSQTPIREALVRLEATGLVQREALKGYRVAPMLSSQDWADLTEARALVEPKNAFLACERADDQFVAGLTSSLRRMAESPTGTSFQDYRYVWEADEEFHRLIAEGSGNQFMLAAFSAIGRLHLQRFRLFAGVGVSDSVHGVAEHRAILAAFESRDPASASKAMEQHVRNVGSRVLKDVSSHSGVR